MARSKYGQSFQDHHDSYKAKRKATRKAAQAEFQKSRKKGGISSYNAAAKGGSRFDYADVKYLRNQGFSDKEIQAHAKTLGRDQLGENIRLNHKAYAGSHYEGGGSSKNIADYDVGKGFNMANVRHLQSKGFTDAEIAKHANSMVLESGKRHGNAMSKFMEAQGQLNYYHGDWKKAKEKAQQHIDNKDETKIDSGNNNQETDNQIPGVPKPENPTIPNVQNNETTTAMTQNVNQDNDINTNIDGNNNVVTNNQDNSIRQYGGDTRVFNYQGGENAGLDTPASMATMAGLYDVSDSPAKQAKFMDLYSTLNKDSQKKYASTNSFAQEAIARARNNESLDINAMDKRIKDREMYSRAKADVMGSNIFGDMFKGSAPSWASPERESAIESPDFESMYNKYSKF